MRSSRAAERFTLVRQRGSGSPFARTTNARSRRLDRAVPTAVGPSQTRPVPF